MNVEKTMKTFLGRKKTEEDKQHRGGDGLAETSMIQQQHLEAEFSWTDDHTWSDRMHAARASAVQEIMVAGSQLDIGMQGQGLRPCLTSHTNEWHCVPRVARA